MDRTRLFVKLHNVPGIRNVCCSSGASDSSASQLFNKHRFRCLRTPPRLFLLFLTPSSEASVAITRKTSPRVSSFKRQGERSQPRRKISERFHKHGGLREVGTPPSRRANMQSLINLYLLFFFLTPCWEKHFQAPAGEFYSQNLLCLNNLVLYSENSQASSQVWGKRERSQNRNRRGIVTATALNGAVAEG